MFAAEMMEVIYSGTDEALAERVPGEEVKEGRDHQRKGGQGLRGLRVGRSMCMNIKSPGVTARAIVLRK